MSPSESPAAPGSARPAAAVFVAQLPTRSLDRFGMADATLECLYDDRMDVQFLARARSRCSA